MNPFDKNTEFEKFVIFQDVTNSLDAFFLDKYPNLSNRLDEKIKECDELFRKIREFIKEYPHFINDLDERLKDMKSMNDKIELSFSNHRQAVVQDKEKTLQWFKNEIKSFLNKDYPELSNQLFKMVDEIKAQFEKRKKLDSKVEKSIKSLVQSQSLCEDVYSLRDEMKTIKQDHKRFQDNLKKLAN